MLKATTIIQREQGLATSYALASLLYSLIHREYQAPHPASVNNARLESLQCYVGFSLLVFVPNAEALKKKKTKKSIQKCN